MVHLDTECLEDLSQYFVFASMGEPCLYSFLKLHGSLDGLEAPGHDDIRSHQMCVLHLAIETQYAGQCGVVVGVDDGGGVDGVGLAHAHVETAVEAG